MSAEPSRVRVLKRPSGWHFWCPCCMGGDWTSNYESTLGKALRHVARHASMVRWLRPTLEPEAVRQRRERNERPTAELLPPEINTDYDDGNGPRLTFGEEASVTDLDEVLTVQGFGSSRDEALASADHKAAQYFGDVAHHRAQIGHARTGAEFTDGTVLEWYINVDYRPDATQ